MKVVLLTLLGSFSINLLFAQSYYKNYGSSILTANLVIPSIQYERGFAKNNTLFFGYNLTPYLYKNPDNSAEKLNLIWGSSVFMDYRKYYNFVKRHQKNKRFTNNSGNFVGIRADYNFRNKLTINQWNNYEVFEQYFLGGIWGLQRNYHSRLHLSFSLAAGVLYRRENKPTFTFNNIDFKIGYVVKAKK